MDVHLILRRDGKVLMARRANTGYGDGLLDFPSGHLERDESVVEGLIREAHEEIGVVVDAAALRCVHVMHWGDPGGNDRVGFFFEANHWNGEPFNREPEKCSELIWVDPEALPKDVVPYPAAGINECQKEITFSVHGWDADRSRGLERDPGLPLRPMDGRSGGCSV